jgi:hypothetical protein
MLLFWTLLIFSLLSEIEIEIVLHNKKIVPENPVRIKYVLSLGESPRVYTALLGCGNVSDRCLLDYMMDFGFSFLTRCSKNIESWGI